MGWASSQTEETYINNRHTLPAAWATKLPRSDASPPTDDLNTPRSRLFPPPTEREMPMMLSSLVSGDRQTTRAYFDNRQTTFPRAPLVCVLLWHRTTHCFNQYFVLTANVEASLDDVVGRPRVVLVAFEFVVEL